VSAAHLPRLETGRLAERAKEALLRSIKDGAFAGGRLPSEERLATQLGVSRTTVREALRSMEEDGLVRRQHGIGTRVNEHLVGATALNRVVGFFSLIAEAGYEPGIAWTRRSEHGAPPPVARRLGRPRGAPLVCVERLFLADGEPVLHLVEQIAADAIVMDFAAEDVPESVFDLADAVCRWRIDHTVVEIVPTTADERVRANLPLARGEPLLRLVETHYSRDGEPFIVSLVHAVDARLRFTVVRKRM
jgi:GntR family transcriptional regulator